MQKTTRRSGSVIFFCARYWIKNICFIYPDGSKYFYRTHARIVQFAVDSENITRVLKHARSSSNAIFQLHKLTVQTFTCSGSIQSSALFFLPLYYSVFSFFYPLLAPSFFFFFFNFHPISLARDSRSRRTRARTDINSMAVAAGKESAAATNPTSKSVKERTH